MLVHSLCSILCCCAARPACHVARLWNVWIQTIIPPAPRNIPLVAITCRTWQASRLCDCLPVVPKAVSECMRRSCRSDFRTATLPHPDFNLHSFHSPSSLTVSLHRGTSSRFATMHVSNCVPHQVAQSLDVHSYVVMPCLISGSSSVPSASSKETGYQYMGLVTGPASDVAPPHRGYDRPWLANSQGRAPTTSVPLLPRRPAPCRR